MRNDCIETYTRKPLNQCTKLELFNALLRYVEEEAAQRGFLDGRKKLYYISAEFLIGKLLCNNLINLGLYEQVREELARAGIDLSELEELESEPSLGNGGLGRLAACFLDSLATLGLPGDGIGLAWHCGLFRQRFERNLQTETPDYWLNWGQESWMQPTGIHYDIPLGGGKVSSTLYEVKVIGFQGKCVRLRLFDVDGVDERLIRSDINFDLNRVPENLTLFLYPDDSTEEGRLLRLYQEYFMVANAARLILDECIQRGSNLHDLADYAAIQINDTHPTMVIPELILLLEERGIAEEEAITIIRNVCGYTNHTILAEALERWPQSYLKRTAPHLMQVIERLDARVRAEYNDPFVQIIGSNGEVRMANIDIHFSHSVNGVARLHTEILKNSELRPFYDIYPKKFNNKTNGITFRRWLMSCNPSLSTLLDNTLGEGWHWDAGVLERLLEKANDASFLSQLAEIKRSNKRRFADWLFRQQGVIVNPDSVFDVQAKRLHEYKRQQLNLLWIIREYRKIRAGKRPLRPVTILFGAKAAPAYTTAKDIIHAILCLSQVIDTDEQVRDHLKVVMIENYNVTAAEKLIPACDISEQISLASKEASGTGNMKFMLNGAVTLGTMDGANVEIAELVGQENIYTFGLSSDEVINLYASGAYRPQAYLEEDSDLQEAVAFLTGDAMLAVGDRERLSRLARELSEKDYFMTFPDFTDYCRTKEGMLVDLSDARSWIRKVLTNIARAGYFSSDRTIEQYNKEIWKLN